MLGWVDLAVERWTRATSSRLDRLMPRIPLWAVQRLCRAKLVHTLRHAWRNSPAQRERWRKSGVRLSDLRSPGVLERLPFTTGIDLAERPEDFFCVPPRELTRLLLTSGTTGKPKKIFLTADDFDRQVRMLGAHMRRFPGASRAMIIHYVRELAWTAPTVTRCGLEEAGMLALISGTQQPVSEHIRLIREHRINVLVTTPAYLDRIMFESPGDLRGLGVRYIHLGGQAWPETFRRRAQSAWGAKVIDAYASTETAFGIASECACQNGLHVTEVDYWVEIVDPETGRVLPDGEEGEVVFTTLSRRGMPLVRYRTGDVAHLMPAGERCACGRPLRKMSRIKGRLDDMLIMADSYNVYPDEIDRAVLGIPEVSDYQLIVEKDGPTDLLHLTVEADGDGASLRDRCTRALLSIPFIQIGCEFSRTVAIGRIEAVPRGTLSAGRAKSIRVIDRREQRTHARPARSTAPPP